MQNRFVVVSGNIASGKTSLVERIGVRLGWKVLLEPVADNPYLTDFYADMRSWSFHLLIYLLSHRAIQHSEAGAAQQSVIMDRSVYEGPRVFGPALHHLGKLVEYDYATYLCLSELVLKSLSLPDLLIYLKAPVSELVHRVQKRNLEFEYQEVDEQYLRLLDSFYDKWIKEFSLCPVLTINTDNFDYVNDTACLKIVIKRILEMLAKI